MAGNWWVFCMHQWMRSLWSSLHDAVRSHSLESRRRWAYGQCRCFLNRSTAPQLHPMSLFLRRCSHTRVLPVIASAFLQGEQVGNLTDQQSTSEVTSDRAQVCRTGSGIVHWLLLILQPRSTSGAKSKDVHLMATTDLLIGEISVDESSRSTWALAAAGATAMARLIIGMTSRTGIRAEALAITNDQSCVFCLTRTAWARALHRSRWHELQPIALSITL